MSQSDSQRNDRESIVSRTNPVSDNSLLDRWPRYELPNKQVVLLSSFLQAYRYIWFSEFYTPHTQRQFDLCAEAAVASPHSFQWSAGGGGGGDSLALGVEGWIALQ